MKDILNKDDITRFKHASEKVAEAAGTDVRDFALRIVINYEDVEEDYVFEIGLYDELLNYTVIESAYNMTDLIHNLLETAGLIRLG